MQGMLYYRLITQQWDKMVNKEQHVGGRSRPICKIELDIVDQLHADLRQ